MGIKMLIKILKFNELKKYIPLSRSSIWRRIKNGNFPKAINLGGSDAPNSAKGWLESDVISWIEKQQDHQNSPISQLKNNQSD